MLIIRGLPAHVHADNGHCRMWLRQFLRRSSVAGARLLGENRLSCRMASGSVETALAPLRFAVQEQVRVMTSASNTRVRRPLLQGDVVRQLKDQQRPELEVKAAVEELKKRKKALEQKVHRLWW